MIKGVVSVFKRPKYTYITLGSLARCNIVDDFNVTLLYEPTKEFDYAEIKKMASQYPYIKDMVEEKKYHTASGMVRAGFEILNATEADSYVYIENDILFNPNWYAECARIRTEASKKYKVGFCSPINGSVKNMKVEDEYRVKNGTPTGIIVIDKQLLTDSLNMPDKSWIARPVSVDKRLGDYLRHDLGYTHITPHDSYAKHIGLKSCNVGIIKDHSRRFVADERIIDLYKMAEEYNAQ